ncbi:MAG TPA: glycoside hydrolase family 15 protein [Candidatus Paceibacterota bacterium]
MKVENDLIEKHLDNIRALQSPSGLFMASRSNVSTGYNKAWLRDNFYTCLAFEEIEDWETVIKTWKAILQIFIKHKNKIDWASKNKPVSTFQYIHARYHPETFEEFWEEWGNKQNDAVGAVLFKLGDLEERGVKIMETPEEKLLAQILVDYLESIEYWHDPDNGVWEEYEEVHASSVGACVAGLKKIRSISGIKIPDYLITKGEESLNKLLPRESKSKFTDLAELSLIYPFNVVSQNQAREILRHIEYHLERDRGVIRYKNDRYYNKNEDGYSEEAEWCFGFPWLSIIYDQLGDLSHSNEALRDKEKSHEYLQKSMNTIYKDQIPELYYSDSNKPNDNTPLAWAESLFVVALLRISR